MTLNHVTLGLWLGSRLDGGSAVLRMGGLCLTATILRHQRPWQRYALY